LGREYVQFGDFSFIADTRDLQKVEMLGRAYYFTKTKLLQLADSKNGDDKWSKEQIDKIIASEPNDEQSQIYSGTTTINRSLYKIMKVMFRVKGIVQVAWCCPVICDGWLRSPRPLFLGRRKINEGATKIASVIRKLPPMMQATALKSARLLNKNITDEHSNAILNTTTPISDEEYETMYPYFLYPYLISENDTIACLKGRIFLDQDVQNAASSLLSSTLTQARRASGLYFTKDTADPNDDFLMQKNVHFKTGAIINGKIKEMKLDAPDATMFSAIQMLVSSNQAETSQVNYAENNRQADSRKTATAIKASMVTQQQLSGVQVTLFSVATKNQYTYECGIIKSRVLAGLINVSPIIRALYARDWTVKPSGDVDVIEKQQIISAMQQAWPIMQQTPAAQLFLSDLLEKMFPDSAPRYISEFQKAEQQKNTQQAQQMQQAIGIAQQVGGGIVNLAEHPEFFSETGRIHALPVVQQAAEQYKQLTQQKG